MRHIIVFIKKKKRVQINRRKYLLKFRKSKSINQNYILKRCRSTNAIITRSYVTYVKSLTIIFIY